MEFFGAEDEARTRDLNLGKVALYQLSYFRIYKLFEKKNYLFPIWIPGFYALRRLFPGVQK